jgi:hypothetical protein
MAMVEKADVGVFLGLWLDEDLLRDEFDAIIAAEYPTSQPPRINSAVRCRRPHRSVSRQFKSRTVQAASATSARESQNSGGGRSPPLAQLPR